jgi:hypothetical protein
MSTATRTQTDREFVISHVDYRLPASEQKLTAAQERTLYYMADGFGKRTPAELERINGGYDWSHFRDSSDAAFREMAVMIRCWQNDRAVEAIRFQTLAEVRAQATRKLQNAQTRFYDNPSAENFILCQKEMLAYQELIKG